jgi:hypothetical protein
VEEIEYGARSGTQHEAYDQHVSHVAEFDALRCFTFRQNCLWDFHGHHSILEKIGRRVVRRREPSRRQPERQNCSMSRFNAFGD